MKRAKLFSVFSAVLVTACLFSACRNGGAPEPNPPAADPAPSDPLPADPEAGSTLFRIAAMRGPTAMGMVGMLKDNETADSGNRYEATVYGTPDEVAALLIGGEVDVATVPCNLASVLYNKTEGAVALAAVNTLGVLYVVENGETVRSVEDLRGKTVYSTGQGTTPEYVFNYILKENGIDPETDLVVEYKSESTEIAALLSSGEEGAIAVLPQPYVTTVQTANEQLRIALDLTAEWDSVSGEESALVTGVLVVRRAFLEENEAAFRQFLTDYQASTEFVNANPAEAAALIETYDIAKAPVAEKALPFCNITFLSGEEMQTRVGGYLSVLYEQNPAAVGGALPDENFYYPG